MSTACTPQQVTSVSRSGPSSEEALFLHERNYPSLFKCSAVFDFLCASKRALSAFTTRCLSYLKDLFWAGPTGESNVDWASVRCAFEKIRALKGWNLVGMANTYGHCVHIINWGILKSGPNIDELRHIWQYFTFTQSPWKHQVKTRNPLLQKDYTIEKKVCLRIGLLKTIANLGEMLT